MPLSRALPLPAACIPWDHAEAGRLHPVAALWSASLGPVLRDALASGQRRVEAFAAAHGLRVVPWDATPLDPFLNINTPDELRTAAALAGVLPP